jgi:2-oxoglutarate ferredoxin oxidoreductase subunit alpha
MASKDKKLYAGNEVIVLAAVEAGAEAMFGYPITPASEILQGWIETASRDKNLQFLQTEDETSAGFATIGSILGGKKAFTATAGPGHVLMQDPLSMAENLRIPFVAIVMQRGGPSTGTVNFSQQEVNLAAFGGNGDGLRVVYSASSIDELYTLTIKSFDIAWRYRFPTILLGDGYLGKMKTKFTPKKPIHSIKSSEILEGKREPTYLRNCFSSEEEFGEELDKNIAEWDRISSKIAESESYKTKDASELIVAHGLVAQAAKEAVEIIRKNRKKIGLFRPVTLNPVDSRSLNKASSGKKKIYIVESSRNQLSHIIKYELEKYCGEIVEISKPAQGFAASEIVGRIM